MVNFEKETVIKTSNYPHAKYGFLLKRLRVERFLTTVESINLKIMNDVKYEKLYNQFNLKDKIAYIVENDFYNIYRLDSLYGEYYSVYHAPE